jgi:hypothetical protein
MFVALLFLLLVISSANDTWNADSTRLFDSSLEAQMARPEILKMSHTNTPQLDNLTRQVSGMSRSSSISALGNVATATTDLIRAVATGNFNSVPQIASQIGLQVLTMINPILGAVAGFVWSFFSMIFGGDQSSALQNMAQRILEETQRIVTVRLAANAAQQMGRRVRNHVRNIALHMENFQGEDLMPLLHADHSSLASDWADIHGDCTSARSTSAACRRWQELGTYSTMVMAAHAHIGVLTELARSRANSSGYMNLLRTWIDDYRSYSNASITHFRNWRRTGNGFRMPEIVHSHPSGGCDGFSNPCISEGRDLFTNRDVTPLWRCRVMGMRVVTSNCTNSQTGQVRTNTFASTILNEMVAASRTYRNGVDQELRNFQEELVDSLANFRRAAGDRN